MSYKLRAILIIFTAALLSACDVPQRQELPFPIISETPITPGMITSEVPLELDPDLHYAIYLHGKIIEDQGLPAEHPEFGEYEYQARLAYLANAGVNMISAVRTAGTDPTEYASLVAQQVRSMQAAGVPAENISVIGFSKGAGIAILVSSQLIDHNVNYVILAICGDWLSDQPQISFNGRVLSIYEQTDELGGSCQTLAERSEGATDFHELSFNTGLGHGAFYQASPDWLGPTLAWISGDPLEVGN